MNKSSSTVDVSAWNLLTWSLSLSGFIYPLVPSYINYLSFVVKALITHDNRLTGGSAADVGSLIHQSGRLLFVSLSTVPLPLWPVSLSTIAGLLPGPTFTSPLKHVARASHAHVVQRCDYSNPLPPRFLFLDEFVGFDLVSLSGTRPKVFRGVAGTRQTRQY